MRARHLAGRQPSGPDRGLLVGRVGALAVALGIGTAVMGLTPVAGADTGPDGSAGSAGQEATRTGDSDSTPRRTRAGTRRGAAAAATATPANPAPAAGRRSGQRSGTVAKSVPAGNGGTAAVSLPKSPADLLGALLTPGGMTGLVQQAMTSFITDLISGASVDTLIPEAALTPEITSVPSTDVAVAEPPVMTAQPDALSVTATDPLDALGGTGTDSPLATPLSWAAVAASRQDPAAATPEVVPAAVVTTGEPVDPAAAATGYQDFLDLPATYAGDATRLELFTYRPTIVNNIAQSFATAFNLGTIAEADKCVKNKGCPAPLSVSNAVGMYAFNVVYALMGDLPNAKIATTVQQLASQPIILDFIATTVAANISANNPNVPSAVANLFGSAAATFVSSTFGSTAGPAGQPNYVALQFVPFLKSLNLPTNAYGAQKWLRSLEGTPAEANAAILGRFNAAQQKVGQQALVSFFSNGTVQGYLGSAFTSSINVLFVPTMADYLGGNVATGILGAGNPNIPALSATIGNAISGLFTSIGGIVATQAGNAFGTFLNAPGQNIPTVLANAGVNGYVAFLSPKDTEPVLPYPQGALEPLIAPAAGTAATAFVNSLFSAPNLQPVSAGLGQFINTLIPGMLSNPGIQQKLGDTVAGNFDNPVIAEAVSGAVANLVAVPAVQTAVTTFVNALGASILASPQALTALANAAGGLVTVELLYGPAASEAKAQAQNAIIDGLRQNAAIDTAVGQAVSSGVVTLFGNAEVLAAVNSAAVSLVTTLLSEPTEQNAIGDLVAADVAKLFTNAALGAAVGAQAKAAVVSLLSNPDVGTALVSLVDTMFSDFFNAQGVLPAFAQVAGEVAAAELAMDSSAAKAAQAAFKANPDVQKAVGAAVGGAVRTLLTDPTVLAALDNTAGSLVNGLLSDPSVQAELSSTVATDVSKALGGGPLADAVGAKAGTAVAEILSNPTVRGALAGLVDTELGDFFKADGVVDAFVVAANTFTLDVLSGNGASAATDARKSLQTSTAVQTAVGAAVGGAVRTLLTDPAVLAVLDNAAGSLVNGLLSDPSVQDELSSAVAAEVSKALGGGQFGDAVGAQVKTAVAGLLGEPAVRNAVAGLVDTELGDFFNSNGVVDAFVVAAETFALDVISTGDTGAAATAAEQSLKTSAAVQNAVGGIVTTSVAELLDDSGLWSAFDASAASLVGALLADPAVQAGVSDKVYLAIWTGLNGTAFAVAVANQVSDAVVDLMKNPNISAGLVGVVDTVLGDFFGTDGVVTAFSTAAGQLASAALAGTYDAVAKQVQAELRTNPAVQLGVNTAVGDAVTSLLTNTGVVSALNDKLAALMSDLLGDPDVQAGLDEGVSQSVSRLVSNLFGSDSLGDAVGKQVGTAVVEIISNPTVKDALEGLVDTELGDFFRSPGVVEAFAFAADTFALEVLTGGKVDIAAQDAVHQLRTSQAIDTAVDRIVTVTVSELLGNRDVWEAVDGTSSFLVQDLLADPDVQEAVSEKVYTNVWVAFNGTALGEVVGDKVAAAVVSLMRNPDVSLALVGLVDTTTADFFGYPGVVDAFGTAAGELAAAEVAGNKGVAPQVIAELRANTDVEQAAGVAVGDAVKTLLTDDTVLSALDSTAAGVVTDLLADPTVQAKLNEQIVTEISKAVGGGDLGEVVGDQVAYAVDTFLSNPSVRVALIGLVDDELGNFFRSDGVVFAFSEAADMFAIEVVTGGNVTTAADDAITWLRNSAPVQNAVIGVITESVGALLSNPYVIQAADSGLTTLLTNLGPYAGQLVTLYVTDALTGSPIAAPVGQALGAAIDQLLTVPGFGSGVVTIIASAVPDFLGQFGVPTAVAGVVGDYAAALVAGEDPTVARQNAEHALTTNPTIDSAAKTTVEDSLTLANLNLLSNPAIQQALGSTVTTLITTLAADDAVQTFIADRDGDAVAELLANTAVVDELASAVGSVVTQLLGYPGFNAALLGAVNQYADDVIDGTDTTTAQENAVKELQSTPAVVAAVNSVVPPAISTLLGYPNVRQALGLYADEVTIALLQESKFNIAFLDNTIGRVADGTVESLITKNAGVTLVDRLVVSIMLGMPAKDWRGFTTQQIIADPSLQLAVGISFGQGVGSLLGDNIFGDLIGAVVAVPATLVIGVGSAFVGFLELIFGMPTFGPSPAAAEVGSGLSHHAQQLPSVADDLYIWNSVIRDLGPLPA